MPCRLINSETIEIFGELDRDTQKDFAGFARQIPGALTLRIETAGGSVAASFDIFATLRKRPGSIGVVGTHCLSAGTIVLLGCDRRIAETSDAVLMIHAPWTSCESGDLRTFERITEMLRKAEKKMATTYAERLSRDHNEVLQSMITETWFDLDSAVAFGLLHGRAGDDSLAFSKNRVRSLLDGCKARANPIAAAKHRAAGGRLVRSRYKLKPMVAA